ncbi:SGT1 family protein Sgt1 [Glonium stellatum]|uniref:SGT1 family protein Sgt1 n=1 Tax=Glonium stellatum TaxID=574774 RepID=A0A8E2JL47_9PEZI|nr:SGT1 family protein Sgt1 [Glonium stellatum]
MSNDDFKWFGEGFEGFPKRLPDDCVEYIIHIIDSKLSDTQTRERLQSVQKVATELEKNLLKEYIWQRDSFGLQLVHGEGTWLLRGRTNYGDSVADEWLIVYLLRELSKKFPEAWVRVYDTDGEFLLIEAANALPKWLNPEVAENRVWINNFKLFIIPITASSTSKSLTLTEALTFISASPSTLLNIPSLESEAFHRLLPYPNAISQTLHHSLLPIPRKLAAILHANPAYIAPAVEAFYLRDPIALRSLQPKDTKTSLRFPPEDFINMRVRFTKVLFAQLRSQEWVPPGVWEDALASLLANSEGNHAEEKAEMGIKLTAGFEMLVKDRQHRDTRAVREVLLLLEDIETGDEPLPTNEEIQGWGTVDDDEGWLDINFEDFERELAGKPSKNADAEGKAGKGKDEKTSGFGDKAAQENLRKMVERFEAFLNDDAAGIEGAEGLDDMDIDNDDEEDADGSGESEDDEEIEFDEKEFARMMREMMGMPSAEGDATLVEEARALARVQELNSDDEGDGENEHEEIRKVMERMEAELNESGALNLDPTPRKIAAAKNVIKGKGKQKISEPDDTAEESSDGEDEINIDFNLAKNLLESLKGQGGMAGPTGNLMGLMGVHLPPDKE